MNHRISSFLIAATLLMTNACLVFSFTQTKILTDRHYRSGSRGEVLYAADNSGNSGGGGALSKKAYNDDALFNYHMMTQKQKIKDYSAMDTYVNTASLWNLAWHDSFVRNGLADFVPPLTDSLNVLVVGSRYQGPEVSAVEDYVGEIDGGEKKEEREQPLSPLTSGKTATDNDNNSSFKDNYTSEEESSISSSSMQQQSPQDSSCSFLAAVFDDNRIDKDDSDESNTELEFTSYDCIMDRGLMADLCASIDDSNDNYYLQGDNNDNHDSNNTTVDEYKSKKDMARLLYASTKRLRECGVYVTNTAPMSNETKEFLSQLGEYLGLQWEFDLDGISDENVSVSVARKFGSCPTIGWQTMARMIEE